MEACDTSEDNAKDEDDDDHNNNEAETGQNSTLKQPEQVNVPTEEDFEVKEEDDDDNNSNPVPICNQCGAEFKSKIALVKHRVEVHNKSLKICDTCGKTCDSQKSLTDHKRQHKKVECDICFNKFKIKSIKRHRSTCQPKVDQEHPEEFQCLLCDFSSALQSSLTRHIKKEHQLPVTHKCNYIIDVENDIHCDYVTKDKRNLNKHIFAVHLTAKYNCDSCKKVFNSSEVLERHVKNAHQVKSGTGPILFHNMEVPKEDNWYSCNKCDYKSKVKCNTERHKKTHLRTAKTIPECIHCGKTFKKAAFLKKHLEKCKEFVPKKVGQEEAVELLKSGFNKEQVRNAFKVFRKVSTKSKVEPNIMKTVNESVKDFGEKWLTSEQIRLKDSTGKKFVTCVTYCKE